MKIFGVDLAEGSNVINLTMPSGAAFPSNANSGELFYRTDLSAAYVNNGTTWNTVGGEGVPTSVTVNSFTGNGVQTSFVLPSATSNTSVNQLLVFVNGVRREITTYSLVTAGSTSILFSVAPANSALIEVVTLPTSITGKTFTTTSLTATQGQTIFSVNYTVGFLMVFVNGVLLKDATDYIATNGTSVTLVESAAVGDIFNAVSLGVFASANHYLKSETYTKTEIAVGWPRKNLIMNSDFDLWQRATSQTSSGYNSSDRWTHDHVGSTKTTSRQAFTVGQTAVPDEPSHYCRTVVTSVAGASNYVIMQQRIESVRTLAGKTATFSFYAKADANKNIAVEFAQRFGTGGAPSADVVSIGVTTFALTTTEQKFTVTVNIPSISGKTLGTTNDGFLSALFWLEAGSAFNSRTNSLGQQSGTFDISHVQLEEGSVATAFQKPPRADELAQCQRYYEQEQTQTAIYSGDVTTGSVYYMNTVYQVEKRVAATVTMTAGSPVAFPAGNPTAGGGSVRHFRVFQTASASGAGVIQFFWKADAEL